MTLFAPRLLLRARLEETRLAGNRGRNTGQGTRVQVEQEACERGAGSRGGRRALAFSLGIGRPGRWTVGHPVVDQERDPRVREEVVGLAGRGVGGHDDGRVGVVGSRREVGVGHEGDVWGEVITCCQMQLEL